MEPLIFNEKQKYEKELKQKNPNLLEISFTGIRTILLKEEDTIHALDVQVWSN